MSRSKRYIVELSVDSSAKPEDLVSFLDPLIRQIAQDPFFVRGGSKFLGAKVIEMSGSDEILDEIYSGGDVEPEDLENQDAKLPHVFESYSGEVCLISSKSVDSSFKDRMQVESFVKYFIRIPVEGDETWEKRMSVIEDIIHKSNINSSGSVDRACFVFDTGDLQSFVPNIKFIFSNRDNVPKKIKDRFIFVQWGNKEERDKLSRGI